MSETTMLDALGDPQMRHAALVHLPIVLSLVTVVMAALAAAWPRGAVLRWIAVGFAAATLGTTFVTVWSGEAAHDAMSGLPTPAARATLDEHERLAGRQWVFAGGTLLLLALAAAPIARLRPWVGWLGVLAAAAGAGWCAVVAHHGGLLVYAHHVVAPAPRGPAEDAAEPGEPAEAPADPRLAHFESAVRPILEEHCLRCHTPERRERSGGLDQTTIAGLLEGGVSGPAVVPGRPDESWLVRRIEAEDEIDVMPPSGRLPAEDVAALRRWIERGAVWSPAAP